MLQFSVIRTGCVLRGHFGDSLLPGGDGARRCRRGGGGRSKGLKTCWSSCSVPGSLLLWPEEGLWPPPWATTSFGDRSWSGREAAPLPVYPSATPGVSGACRPPALAPRAPRPVFLSGLLGSRGRWSSQVLAEDWLQQFLHICPREVSALTPSGLLPANLFPGVVMPGRVRGHHQAACEAELC